MVTRPRHLVKLTIDEFACHRNFSTRAHIRLTAHRGDFDAQINHQLAAWAMTQSYVADAIAAIPGPDLWLMHTLLAGGDIPGPEIFPRPMHQDPAGDDAAATGVAGSN